MSDLPRRTLLTGLASLPAVGGLMVQSALAAESEAEARKRRTIMRLKQEGVPYIDWLPVIEDAAGAKPPTAADVARRFCALMLVTHKAISDDHAASLTLRAKFGDRARFSGEELIFMETGAPDEASRIGPSWVCEAAVPMAWALGRFETLERPEQPVDVDRLATLIVDDGGEALVTEARLRPINAILDEADLIYRYHWAVRQSQIDGQDAPARLDADVVMERHKGLNWLIGYEADWDEVTTDT
jgi:hypothetical protein